MKKTLAVFRCGECADDLKEYNPYVFEDGTPVPLEDIEVVVVPGNYCENAEDNLNNKPQLQTPLWLKDAMFFPWIVYVWETEDDREQGIVVEWEHFDNFNEAYTKAVDAYNNNGWAAYEIAVEFPDGFVSVYFRARTTPIADGFIKHKGDEKSEI